jgi:hypothetical protein
MSPRHTFESSRWALGALLACACTPAEMRPVDFSSVTTATDTSGDGDGDPSGDGDGDPTGDGDGDGDGDPTGDGDGEPGDPPTVVSTIPTAGSMAVDPNTTITVTFSEAMDSSSITSNGGADTCSGAVRVSSDDFATCVPLLAEVMAGDGDTAFTLTPVEPLRSRRNYRIRVVSYATSAIGVELGTDYNSPQPFVSRYYHTIVIDGTNDFDLSDEEFATTSPGFSGYVAWDADYVYLAMQGPDLASDNPQLFWFAYLGGNPSSPMGVTYNGQQPTLPFGARWHPRWKSDDTFTDMQEYAGSWGDAAAVWLEGPDWVHAGDYLELRLSRTALDSGNLVPVVMGLLREAPNNEATYAGVPDSAFSDGFDPDIEAHYEFDLDGSVLPVEHPAL